MLKEFNWAGCWSSCFFRGVDDVACVVVWEWGCRCEHLHAVHVRRSVLRYEFMINREHVLKDWGEISTLGLACCPWQWKVVFLRFMAGIELIIKIIIRLGY